MSKHDCNKSGHRWDRSGGFTQKCLHCRAYRIRVEGYGYRAYKKWAIIEDNDNN